jgi:hypothetical protein
MHDLLEVFGHGETLALLGITELHLETSGTDSDLLDTLRITHEVLVAIRAAGLQEVFLFLPQVDQANFLRWVGMIDDPKLRTARTQVFISALEESPLATQRLSPGSMAASNDPATGATDV